MTLGISLPPGLAINPGVAARVNSIDERGHAVDDAFDCHSDVRAFGAPEKYSKRAGQFRA